MRRRLPIIGLAAVLLVVAAHGLLWHFACARITSDTEAWAAAQRAQGNTVTLGEAEPEGWPLAARVKFAGVTLGAALAGLPGGAVYQADAATVGIDLRDISHLVIGFEGPQHLRLGPAVPLDFTTDRTALQIPLNGDPLTPQADLILANLRVSSQAGSGLNVAAAALHLVLPSTANQPLVFNLTSGPIDLPPGAALGALGSSVSRLDLLASVTAPGQTDAASWRAAGGAVTVRQLALNWGALSVTGNAAAHLDANLQPAGNGTLRLVGTAAALDALVHAHLIDPRGATAATAVLTLLQRPQADGPPAVELPLTLEDQTLQLGHFRLLKLPAMIW